MNYAFMAEHKSQFRLSSTYQAWLYLTVVIDFYSRAVAGWPMSATMAIELVLNALMMSVWHRRSRTAVMIYSHQ